MVPPNEQHQLTQEEEQELNNNDRDASYTAYRTAVNYSHQDHNLVNQYYHKFKDQQQKKNKSLNNSKLKKADSSSAFSCGSGGNTLNNKKYSTG